MMKIKNVFFIMTCLFEFYLGITGPIFVLYLYEIGFDSFRCNLLLGISLMSQFIFEVPCGILSDYMGRRKTVLLSGIAMICVNILFVFTQSYYMLCVAQAISGISFALYSGSLNAWISEAIDRNEIHDVFLRKNKFLSTIMLFSGIVGSFIADLNIKIVFICCVITEVVYIILALKYVTLDDMKKERNNNIENILNGSVQNLFNDQNILSIMLFNLVLVIATSGLFVYWSPLLSKYTNNNMKIAGIIWSLMRLGLILGNGIAQRIKKEEVIKKLLFISVLCGIVLLLIAINVKFYLYIILLIIFEVILGIINSLKEARFNYVIEENKATLLSINAVFVSLGNFFSIIAYGYIANVMSMKFCIFLGALFLLIYCLYTFVVKKFLIIR